MKFRVWDKYRKKFCKQISSFMFDRDGNINLVVYLDRPNKTREIFDIDKIFTNEFIIMQYTGLKNKNGNGPVEVYEGDIITIDGILKGNIYEIDKKETDIVVPQIGTKAWKDAYEEAVDRGYDYSE